MGIKESTHWYDKKGQPAYTIIGANGKERNTTLRDARKEGYVPSVTTVLGVAAKPALEIWKINQALMAALTLPRLDDESLDDFMGRAKQDSKEQAIEAASRGTEIHADVEKGFLGEGVSPAYDAVLLLLNRRFPNVTDWVAEDSFCKHGYGGKIDLYCRDAIVVDFKTKDNLAGKDPSKLVYDEHGMQLSAYSHGLGIEKPTRISIFIDRDDPTIALLHEWDEESHERHLNMFLSLLDYWFLLKKYKPTGEDT